MNALATWRDNRGQAVTARTSGVWADTPEAKALLAEAVQNPPAKQVFNYAFGETDCRYVGSVAKRLRKLREDFIRDHVMDTADAATRALNSRLTVTKAIDQARAAAGVCDAEETFWVEERAA